MVRVHCVPPKKIILWTVLKQQAEYWEIRFQHVIAINFDDKSNDYFLLYTVITCAREKKQLFFFSFRTFAIFHDKRSLLLLFVVGTTEAELEMRINQMIESEAMCETQ